MGSEPQRSSFSDLFAQLEQRLIALDNAKAAHDLASEQVAVTGAAYEAAVDQVRDLQTKVADQMALVLPADSRNRSA